MSQKPSELEQDELLAFELYYNSFVSSGRPSRSSLQQDWRDSNELRAHWRSTATRFKLDLNEAGLDIRLHRSTWLRKALKDLITVPAQKAYEVGKD